MRETLTTLRSMNGFHKQEILPMLVVESLGACLAPRIDVLGKVNLATIQNLNQQPNTHFWFMPDHQNDADTTAFFKSLTRNGFESLAKRIIPIKGKQLEDRRDTKWLSRSYDTILAWPPCIEPSEEEIPLRLLMNLDTLSATREAIRNGVHILVYPETQVSPDGTLKKGYPEVARFVSQQAKDNTFIVPVGIWGTKNMFSTDFPFFRPGKPTVNFGEPMDFATLKNQFGKDFNGMMDHVMRKIAILLPQQYRGAYV